MSFGFSVGDVIAVGQLINDVIKCLREPDGAKSEYQELTRELETLQKALDHLDSIRPVSDYSKNLESIKFAALSCRQPLEEFLTKTRKYEKSLGVWNNKHVVKDTVHKLQWAFLQKDHVDKLQKYLSVHVMTINMMLAEFGLEQMDLDAKKSDTRNLHIRERLEETHKLLNCVKDNIGLQASAVGNASSQLSQLFRVVNGEIKASWQRLSEMVTKVWYVISEISFFLTLANIEINPACLRSKFIALSLKLKGTLLPSIPVGPSSKPHSLLKTLWDLNFPSLQNMNMACLTISFDTDFVMARARKT